jgi:fatty-acid peroxygenase
VPDAERTLTAPTLPWPDDSLRLLRDGYLYGERGFRRAGSNAFRTRLLGRRVMVVRGLDAARFFYERGRFDRSPGAVPASAVHLLQDSGSVQTLRGEEHHTRKRLFVGVLEDHRGLVAGFREEWATAASQQVVPVPLLSFASSVLTTAIQRWVGIDQGMFQPSEFTSMIENAGRVGPPNWAARMRRAGTERTARSLIRSARAGEPQPTPLYAVARYREGGELLPLEVAAVELLNLLRPTVAVARFVTFAALTLHRRPDLLPALSDADGRRAFAQEVRRFWPFFPMVGGHATRDLAWRGLTVPEGSWVMLDLFGTDHDPGLWPHPRQFDPTRFSATDGPVVAQGFGDAVGTHHCPGEPATVDLIAAAVDLLLDGPGYRVPDQDLRVSLRGFPAAPRDGFVVDFR